jgi:hypothetical protein
VRTVLGLKAHSGWAALVALGTAELELEVVDRRRIELVDGAEGQRAKQPYHASERLAPEAARDVVKRAVASARRIAGRQVRNAVDELRAAGHEVAAFALLTGDPMPEWSVEEILAVHFRMHRAEGALFRDALAAGVDACGVKLVAVLEKQLPARAKAAFGPGTDRVVARIAALRKSAGPPWGKDQKDAALAAAIALRELGHWRS